MDWGALFVLVGTVATAAGAIVTALRRPLRAIHHDVNASRTALVEAHRKALDEMQARLDEAQSGAIADLRRDLNAALAEIRAHTGDPP